MKTTRPSAALTGSSPIALAAEAALVAVAVATAMSFTRLFDTASFLPSVLLAGGASHLLAAATRRAGWGIGRSAALSAVGLVYVVSAIRYWSTTTVGVPTSHTLQQLRLDLDQAWAAFQDVTAPAPAEPGFVVALMVALWCAAYLADWAAFRLWSPVEAVVPTAALFMFSALMGTDERQLTLTALFLATLVTFQLLHHIAKQLASRHWINPGADRGSRTLVTAGLAMAVAAVSLAVLAGPAIPGAQEPAVIEWRDLGDDTPARVTVSPMVNIRSQLVEQSDVDLFTVRSPEAAYWRLTALDTFDGTIWKSSGSFQSASGQLPRAGSAQEDERPFTQQYTIEALDSLWLPAAFEPVAVQSAQGGLVYEVETSTLIVGAELSTSNGLAYEATSVDVRLDPTVLEQPGEVPADIAARFLDLPANLDQDLRIQGQEITQGATSDYQRMLMLQEWFRSEFTYNEQVALNHDIDSIAAFLEVREGYCEQFAGTFAAFARSLGIPSRVAVGFTWGDTVADDPLAYQVTGRHAHAWPEVWLPGPGWVPFEPTPSRGNPLAEEVTGVAAQQAPAPGQPDTPGTVPPTTQPAPDAPPVTDPELAPTPDAGLSTGPEGLASSPAEEPWWSSLVRPLLGLGLASTIYALVVVGVAESRHRARRNRIMGETPSGREVDDAATDARRRARLAWFDATRELALSGLRPLPAETALEFAGRMEACTDLDPAGLRSLADADAAATYGRRAPDLAGVERAEQAVGEVKSWVRSSTTRWQRLRSTLDPRPLLPTRSPVLTADPLASN